MKQIAQFNATLHHATPFSVSRDGYTVRIEVNLNDQLQMLALQSLLQPNQPKVFRVTVEVEGEE